MLPVCLKQATINMIIGKMADGFVHAILHTQHQQRTFLFIVLSKMIIESLK